MKQVKNITKKITRRCQICIFAAYMTTEITELTKRIMKDPVMIMIKNLNISLEGVKQFYLPCSNDEKKYESLFEILANIDVLHFAIFVNTNDRAEHLAPRITDNVLLVACIISSTEN